MKLIWFELKRYKRFSEPTKINLDGKLVAIVGPNEAGKSSLLEAMLHLSHQRPLKDDGPSHEITREASFEEDDPVIFEWTFLLEDSDKELIEDIPDATSIRWFSLQKTLKGEQNIDLTPNNVDDETHQSQIFDILLKRVPKILFFRDSDRGLQSSYNLASFFQKRMVVPAILNNLAAAGNLDLEALYAAKFKQDASACATLLERANTKINGLVQSTWSQSHLSVYLSLDGLHLKVLLKSSEGAYFTVADRSDGLRQFLELLLFLSKQPQYDVKPIVLIDEADRHLHYDAQADLVQMFAKQDLAQKIIYTTHSIGALPEDLGSGIRLVETDGVHSKIRNWFWESDRPGYSNLLFGMGARTLAFIPVRYAVIMEGATDMLLLPTLFKELLDKETLGFQVVPGLSKSSAEQLALIDNEGARVIYVTDADDAGRQIQSSISSVGISSDRIISLPLKNDSDTVLEDYVSGEAYVDAVNKELYRSHGNSHQISLSDISGANRPQLLENWCQTRKIKSPNKGAIAYRLLENKYEKPLVAADAETALHDLYQQITTALEISSHSDDS